MPTPITFGAMSARGFGFGLAGAKVVRGEQAYPSVGTYTWVAPAGVTSVSVVAVGSGSSGIVGYAGAGGGLGYKNNYSVTPGNSYTVVVSAEGSTDSYFVSTAVVKGGRAVGSAPGGTHAGDGGGNGGNGGCGTGIGGGGGAGGYSGAGGGGGTGNSGGGGAGSGGGGGGGGSGATIHGGGGGGVGLLGQGSNGAGGASSAGGGGGSGGAAGGSGYTCICACFPYCGHNVGGNGGNYGAGGGSAAAGCGIPYGTSGIASQGAVRIVWPGATRQFPSTDVGTP